MGDIKVIESDELLIIENSNHTLMKYPSFRADTYFYKNMKVAEEFFNSKFRWTKLGYLIETISNGENLDTKWYAVDEDSNVMYLSVSQITEFGLEDKNTHYLINDVLDNEFGKSKRNVKQIAENMIIVTRSGSPGIAISSNHPTFDYDNYMYIPSGFLIYFSLRNSLGISPEVITYYLNLRPVRYYLIANSSGRCQRNISQEILHNLPVPEEILDEDVQKKIIELYNDVESKSVKRINTIASIKNSLNKLWSKSWDDFIELLSGN